MVRGLPDVGGSAGGGVLLHSGNQQKLMLAAAGHKIGSSLISPMVSFLPSTVKALAEIISFVQHPETKARVSSFQDSNRNKYHRTKLSVNCLHILSLRRLLLLGTGSYHIRSPLSISLELTSFAVTADGHIKACV